MATHRVGPVDNSVDNSMIDLKNPQAFGRVVLTNVWGM